MKTVALVSGLLFIAITVSGWSSVKENELRTALLTAATYSPRVRPNDTLTAKVGLSLISINDLNTEEQSMSVTGWLTVEWTDYRLTWEPASYDEVDHFFAVDSEIWKPEIFIDNAVEDVSILQNSYLLFKVEENGTVDWEYPMIFQTSCTVDTTYYPFDTQKCMIEITSWAYTKTELLLTHLRTEVNADELGENGEWVYLGSTVSSRELTESTSKGTEAFSVLDFTIVMERRSSFYVNNVLLPVLLTSFLNILVFFLPADSGEKVSYSLTVLLALAVLLTLIADSMPNSSLTVSVLSVYLAFTLCMGVIGVVFSVVILRIHFKSSDKPIPDTMKRMVRNLFIPVGRLRCCCCCCKRKRSNVVTEIKVTSENGNDVQMREHFNNDNDDDVDDNEMTWQDVASHLDWFLMVVTFFITVFATVIFMTALVAGGLATAHVV